MNSVTQAHELQQAILARAKQLADESLGGAKKEAQRIIEHGSSRLREREAHEHARIEAMADRVYRQRVQSSEIKMRSELDQLKWVHVQAVIDRLQMGLTELAADGDTYMPLLKKLLAQAAEEIPDEKLVAQVNVDDYKRLKDGWESFAKAAVPGKHIELSPDCKDCSGGVVVRNEDNTIRVDNSFGGRMERMAASLHRLIMERLFASAEPMGALFSG